MMRKFDKLIFYSLVIPFFLDRLTKYLVVSGILKNQEVTSFFDIYLTFNRGISWGMGNSSDQMQFIVITALVALVMVVFAWNVFTAKMHRYAMVSSCMIMSGALSNFFDRIWYGGVVDFIRFSFGDWSFPVFNVADIFISLGACLLIYFYWHDEI